MSSFASRPGFGLWAAFRAGLWAVVHLIGDLPVAIVALILGSLVVGGIASAPALGIGILLLALVLPACGWLVEFERRRVAAVLGVTVPAPVPLRQGWWRSLISTRAWVAAGYAWLFGLWGTLVASLVLTVLIQAIVLTLVPFFAGADGFRLGGRFDVGSAPDWLSVVGLVLVLLVPFLALALSKVDVLLVRWACGQAADETIARLESRVERLTTSRDEVVDSVEAERRRIERDLHDGPQQRLVAIAMELGMAREVLESDPERARDLIERAHVGAKEAVTEMRQVARGIAPPVLTDRGLDAALSALAARSPVPVDIELSLDERPDPTIEAIAYFCVSECLTNVAKHSGARQATVSIAHRDPARLVIDVGDDGRGGADPALGTGLKGLAARVAAVDGTLSVSSPHGGPTRVRVELPWRITEGDR